MREIKFRGVEKDKSHKRTNWVYGLLTNDIFGDYYIEFYEKGDTGQDKIQQIKVIPETVGQLAGPPDINDKEIYEGDILDFTVFDCLDNDKQYRGCVVYCGSRFMLWNKPNDEFYGSDGGFELDEVNGQGGSEVIGNIYENVKWSDSKVK